MLGKFVDAVLKLRKYIAIGSTIASSSLFIYYIGRALMGLDPLYPFGENMVSIEIVFIPNILFMKPITIAVILGYLAVLTTLSHISTYVVENWGEREFFVLEIFTGVLMFVAGYEILFNFTLWSAMIASITTSGIVNGNIDLLYNVFPNPDTPWNIVFATKIFYLIFLSSATSFYYINRWKLLKREIEGDKQQK